MCLAKLKENKLLGFLGSIRLAFTLFCAIILVCLIGALVNEELRPGIYYSRWFLVIMFLFALNLLACAISRLSLNKNKLGSTITHLAVLIILFGSAVSFFASQRGSIEFMEGNTVDCFASNQGNQPLNFQVLLDKFNVEWYPPRDYYEIKAVVMDKKLAADLRVLGLREYKVKGTDYSFSVIRYLPDFEMDDEGKIVNASAYLNNPAILLEIKSPKGKEQRWVFAKHPGMPKGEDENIQFVFELMVKEYRSAVKFISRDSAAAKIIKVNSPAVFKGYTFYQSGSMQEPALEVVRDPGVFWVFLGFVFLNAGIIINFVQRTKKNKLSD